jgi:CheY-like chemotaxis protein
MTMPDRNSKPPNSRTVLVLDNDVLVRMPVVQFLRDCGYRVVEAATIDEAIALLEKTNIPLDVVLSSIDIPGSMNGFGFAQWARSVRPELKILLAATPERTVRNAAELCEVGPTLKRPYTHKLVLESHQAASDRSGAAGRKVTAPATARVDLDRSRCARVGVGPCSMARVVVKNGKLVHRAAPLMPKDGTT